MGNEFCMFLQQNWFSEYDLWEFAPLTFPPLCLLLLRRLWFIFCCTPLILLVCRSKPFLELLFTGNR